MKQSLLNADNLHNAIYELCEPRLDEDQKCLFEDTLDSYVEITTESLTRDFDKYIHRSDKSIFANLAQIDINWDGKQMNYPFEDLSNLANYKRFDDLVKAADSGSLSEQQLNEAQEWCLDWFWFAFGTFGITYNFDELISSEEYEMARENYDC